MLCLPLVLALAAPAGLPAANDAKVKAAIQQAREGLLDAAVGAFDEAIAALAQRGPEGRADLIVAHVHRGAALVALGKEEAAKDAFRAAVILEPALRLEKGQFPDRVIRVFDAARTGKTKSVMERPTGAPKKAGIGALGIAGIIGGAVVLAGGAVAAASGGGSTPSATPTPVPSPTPDPAAQVTPVPGTASGPIRLEIAQLNPPSGSTIPCGTGCSIDALIRVSASGGFRNLSLQMYDTGGMTCVNGFSQRFDLNGSEPFIVPVRLAAFGCAPRTINTLWVVQQTAPVQSVQAFNVRYTFTP